MRRRLAYLLPPLLAFSCFQRVALSELRGPLQKRKSALLHERALTLANFSGNFVATPIMVPVLVFER